MHDLQFQVFAEFMEVYQKENKEVLLKKFEEVLKAASSQMVCDMPCLLLHHCMVDLKMFRKLTCLRDSETQNFCIFL